MNKFKTRKDIPAIAKMLSKIKNPSEGTIANLKDISQVIADEEKGQATASDSIGGTSLTVEEPEKFELTDSQKTQIEAKKKAKEEQKAKINELKSVKDGGQDMSVNTETTTDVDLGNTMIT